MFGSYDLADLARFIDWTPFFQTWELKGRYPAILDDPNQGAAARTLFDDAQAMLKQIVEEKWLAPKAVVGFWPAARTGDDIALYADDDRNTPIATLYTLRQQLEQRDGRPIWRSPISSDRRRSSTMSGPSSSPQGFEDETIVKRFERLNDDYSSILLKALADRLAEAFAKAMHARVRREFWPSTAPI